MKAIHKFAGGVFVLTLLGVVASRAVAQDTEFSFNARAGLAVPTFDIADVAEPGFLFGGGIAYRTGRVELRGNADFGFHDIDDDVRDLLAEPDAGVDVFHFVGSIGYHLTDPSAGPWTVLVNAGAGLLSFNLQDASSLESVETDTNFAINAGAEIGYAVSPNLDIFLNLQGDIAFVSGDPAGDKLFDVLEAADLFDASTAWVWPFSAGFKLRI